MAVATLSSASTTDDLQVAFYAQIFVAVLGASNLTYVEALANQNLYHVIGAHTRAFSSFGGVTDAIVCDGMRTAVTKADRYEPVPNATYLEMATHYQMTVLPARPYHPREWVRPMWRVPLGMRPSVRGTRLSICGIRECSKSLASPAVIPRLARLMNAWFKVEVLILDDFLIRPINPDAASDTLEVIEDRHGLRSTILTSQLPVANWYASIGDPTIADALLDRLTTNLHRIELNGESMRKVTQPPEAQG